ncbi:hypothetical protein [Pseudomonas sp.]|uniref:hypothetical protein n=1 Tax=Pseudomonas sp. TaxID=306 RepID=UPI0027353CD1|nr:hypothetical protein [Pseudomonas sp.]MDP2747967.1 hypothetical protein [Pseudomonas sp.]
MKTEVLEAVGDQPGGRVAQPMMDSMTPEEWLVLRFYRQLEGPERLMMIRMMEALVMRLPAD